MKKKFFCLLLCNSTLLYSEGIIDNKNSTFIPLAANQIFTGSATNVTNYSLCITSLKAEPNNASGTLYLEFSPDGTYWDSSLSYEIVNPTIEPPHSVVPTHRFFRVRYVNNAVDQTSFRLQSLHHSNKSKGLTSTMDATLSDTSDAENVRAVLMGKNEAGRYTNVITGPDNALGVNLINPLSPFGSILTTQLHPLVELNFSQNIHNQLVEVGQFGSGTATINNARLQLSTGTTTSSFAGIVSREVARYQPGLGIEARFSALFTPGVAGTTQFIGLGDSEDALQFGYNGEKFGILRRYGGLDEVWTLSITGEPTANGTLSFTLDGATINLPILNADTIGEVVKKITEVNFAATGFFAYYQGNEVIFISLLSGPKAGTFQFNSGATGLTGTFTQTRAGVTAATEFITQEDWSHDKADGKELLPILDWSKGNVFRIQLQWLGFGMIQFGIQHPKSGNFITVHKMEYANNHTIPSVYNPCMSLNAAVTNGSTTNDIVLHTSSMGAFSHGEKKISRVRHALFNSINATNTETPIFVFYVKRLAFGKTNRTKILLNHLSVGTDSKYGVIIRIYRNTRLTSTFSLTDIDSSESIVSYSKNVTSSAIIPSLGAQIMTLVLAPSESKEYDLSKNPLIFYPGDFVVVTAQTFSGMDGIVGFSCTWMEDF